MNSLHRSTRPRAAAFAFSVHTLVALFVGIALPAQAQIPTPKVLYGFQQLPTDVIQAAGPIAQGRDGNLYGTGVNRGAKTKAESSRFLPQERKLCWSAFLPALPKEAA